MKRVTLQNYRQDTLYPRVVSAAAKALQEGHTVAPVDVFVREAMAS